MCVCVCAFFVEAGLGIYAVAAHATQTFFLSALLLLCVLYPCRDSLELHQVLFETFGLCAKRTDSSGTLGHDVMCEKYTKTSS